MQALELIRWRRPLIPAELRVGTRRSPLALYQTRLFIRLITLEYPALLSESAIEEHAIVTSGDHNADARLADIGGKGLFAKEIHEALRDHRIDCAVHSLKDLETELPNGIVLACVLAREDARDALILGPACGPADPSDPWSAIPTGAVVGTASVRRQSQILHRRPDLHTELLRGNVRTRLDKVKMGEGIDASLLAVAGLRRLGLDGEAALILDPDIMVPAAGQGIIGITVRADDVQVRELLATIEDPEARVVATAERALLAALDGSCRTPIGSYARLLDNGDVHLTGLIARANGRFLLKRSLQAPAADAQRLGTELGRSLRADAPVDVFI
jgi:hydroxymethylbilane synthase